MYYFGQGVETSGKKQRPHLAEAAIGGHPGARHNLASLEGQNGRYDRAAKHFIIGKSFRLQRRDSQAIHSAVLLTAQN